MTSGDNGGSVSIRALCVKKLITAQGDNELMTLSRRRIPLRSTCAQPHDCPAPLRMKILAQIPFFAGLSEAELERIDDRMISLSWAKGDTIYAAEEPAEHLYVLAAGQAKVFQSASSGQDTIVDLLAPGDLFGGLGLLGRSNYPETAEALSTTCALRIDTVAFREVLLEYPQVALRVLDDVSVMLVQARSDAGQQATATVAQRVATVLLRLSDKFGQPGADEGVDGTLIQLPLSRADVAALTGSTAESVSRAMSQLRKDGVIDSGRGWTSVLDRDELAALAAPAVPVAS